jgi:DNA-binding transcriptional MerR regulator
VGDEGVDQVAKGADQSRCDFKGRQDRVALVTQGAGAAYPNIRRVYAVGTDRQDGRRILRCREADTNLDGVNDLIRVYNDQGEPINEQTDSDYDGLIDTWTTFSRMVVAKAEVDRNRDGKPDEFRTYARGRLSRLQKDSNFDGLLDTWQVYEEGKLKRVGIDVNGDQRVDRWFRDEEQRRAELLREKAEVEAAEAAAGAPAGEEDGDTHGPGVVREEP